MADPNKDKNKTISENKANSTNPLSQGGDIRINPNKSLQNSKKLEASAKPEDGIVELEGGFMLTTSEILDFAEGTDSLISQ